MNTEEILDSQPITVVHTETTLMENVPWKFCGDCFFRSREIFRTRWKMWFVGLLTFVWGVYWSYWRTLEDINSHSFANTGNFLMRFDLKWPEKTALSSNIRIHRLQIPHLSLNLTLMQSNFVRVIGVLSEKFYHSFANTWNFLMRFAVNWSGMCALQ